MPVLLSLANRLIAPPVWKAFADPSNITDAPEVIFTFIYHIGL